MKKLVETVLENLSTTEVFLFRVACGSCGTEYGNRARTGTHRSEVLSQLRRTR